MTEHNYQVGSSQVNPAGQFSRTAILVLGMHRSGTSALTGVLARLGCDLPATLMPAHPTNSKGFGESIAIAKLNDNILASAGSKWNDWQDFNEEWFKSDLAAEFKLRAKEVLFSEFGLSPFFVIKDPRICRILPFWIDVLTDSGVGILAVHIHRNPLEVASSLNARDAIHTEIGKMIWLQYVISAERNSRTIPRAFTSYSNLLQCWAVEIERIRRQLKIVWPRYSFNVAEEIDDFVSPQLRHQKIDDRHLVLENLDADPISDAYRILNRWSHAEAVSEDVEILSDIHSACRRFNRCFSEVAVTLQDQQKRLLQLEARLKEVNN